MALPVHSESYNPPSEYILDEEERKKWEETEPEDRKLQFLPQKFDALRKVKIFFFLSERLNFRFLNMTNSSQNASNVVWISIWHHGR